MEHNYPMTKQRQSWNYAIKQNYVAKKKVPFNTILISPTSNSMPRKDYLKHRMLSQLHTLTNLAQNCHHLHLRLKVVEMHHQTLDVLHLMKTLTIKQRSLRRENTKSTWQTANSMTRVTISKNCKVKTTTNFSNYLNMNASKRRNTLICNTNTRVYHSMKTQHSQLTIEITIE